MSGMPVERNASRARPSQGGGNDSGSARSSRDSVSTAAGRPAKKARAKSARRFPIGALADQRVGDGADDGQHGGEQQPGERTARRVPAQDDAHADGGHDRDVQRDQGDGFEVLRRHDCGAGLSPPRPATRSVSAARSS